ncbi:hypothetical protein TNCV_2849781 [Trichonephila clavipes]|nr:hypothetical protein TNCV_2849781 [Trichonephila clavipes]
MSKTCLRLDSGQESTLDIPYAVLFQLSSMFSRRAISGQALSSRKTKGISNGSSVRDDVRSKYLVYIPSARQSAITNDMQVRTSTYADSTPYHPTSSSVL